MSKWNQILRGLRKSKNNQRLKVTITRQYCSTAVKSLDYFWCNFILQMRYFIQRRFTNWMRIWLVPLLASLLTPTFWRMNCVWWVSVIITGTISKYLLKANLETGLMLKVRKSQKQFFLKLRCSKSDRNFLKAFCPSL